MNKATDQSSDYWNTVSRTYQQTDQQKLLRCISDLINISLFTTWLPSEKAQSLLKTDLFDESLTDGLYPLLSHHAERVVGIDITSDFVAAARQRHPQMETVNTDVCNLPFPSETFDIIVSNSTLDHFETSKDIIAGLQELKRVLKKQGQLLITLDNYTNPLVFLRNALPFNLLNRLGIVPYYVGATFSARHLRRVLEEMDFTVVATTSCWHFPRIFLAAIALILTSFSSDKQKQRVLRAVLSFEHLSKLPTKYITGQFIAVKAIKK